MSTNTESLMLEQLSTLTDDEGYRRCSLEEFICGCNKRYPRFELTARLAPSGRPNRIEVRFSPVEYHKFYDPDRWPNITANIKRRTKGATTVATSEEEFLLGIIDIDVNCWSPAYREHVLILALEWLVDHLISA